MDGKYYYAIIPKRNNAVSIFRWFFVSIFMQILKILIENNRYYYTYK